MNTDVVMKANSHGIRIILNEDNSMEQILSDIREKLYSQEVFLKKSGRVPVTFEGRLLSSGEEEQILYELNHLQIPKWNSVWKLPNRICAIRSIFRLTEQKVHLKKNRSKKMFKRNCLTNSFQQQKKKHYNRIFLRMIRFSFFAGIYEKVRRWR